MPCIKRSEQPGRALREEVGVMLPKLTPKQAAFVQEYMIDLNATQAAIRAGYKEKNAYQIGSENLRKPQIQAAIQEARKEIEGRCAVSVDWVLAQIAEIAADGDRKTSDRLRALEMLAKHFGLLERKEEVDAEIHVYLGEAEDWLA